MKGCPVPRIIWRLRLLCLGASPKTGSTCSMQCQWRLTDQDSIIGTGFSTSLCVTKCRDASIKLKRVMKDTLDVVRIDVIKVTVYGTLRDDNNGSSFANLPVLSP